MEFRKEIRTRQRVQYFIDSYCISLITIQIVTPSTVHQHKELEIAMHKHKQTECTDTYQHLITSEIVLCPRFILQIL